MEQIVKDNDEIESHARLIIIFFFLVVFVNIFLQDAISIFRGFFVSMKREGRIT